jgi:fructose-specific phosphotransferase system IIA component
MRLTDILQAGCVKMPVSAGGRQEAIFELADVLWAQGLVRDAAELKEAVWKREQTRTTGIGHGIAIPHGKVTSCERLCMAIGKAATPIDFAAIDGKPVELIILLASPLDQTGPHIQALARISRMLTEEAIRARMKAATTASELYDLIVQHETQTTA